MNLARTRVTRAGVASFLYYHPALRSLQYEDTLGALTQVDKLGEESYSALEAIFLLAMIIISAANRLIGEVVQSRRRPLLGPSPG